GDIAAADLRRSRATFNHLFPTVLDATAGTNAANAGRVVFVNAGGGNAFTSINYTGTVNYGGRFMGQVQINTAGTYTFGTRSDDGTVLFVDGQPVVSNNAYQGLTTRTGTINLTAGRHDLEMYFYQGGGGAGAFLGYSGPDNNNLPIGTDDASITAAAIPAANLF